jgi:thiol-disulfide isomerase/thioredoxin
MINIFARRRARNKPNSSKMDFANLVGKAAAVQEKAVDEELNRYDYLLQDDHALEALRAKRINEMKQAAQQQQGYLAAGHGSYKELDASQQDGRDMCQSFFDATKASENLVVHFYRPTTAYCDVFHKLLDQLAQNHLETMFLRINVQDSETKAVSFLVERLNVRVMPTLVLIQKREMVHQIRGFDEFFATAAGGSTNNNPEALTARELARVLRQHGVITWNDRDEEEESLAD